MDAPPDDERKPLNRVSRARDAYNGASDNLNKMLINVKQLPPLKRAEFVGLHAYSLVYYMHVIHIIRRVCIMF